MIALREKRASIVTDQIESFTPTGIQLKSGEHLDADIIITALGVPNYLKAEMVKDGAVIIDVGINRVEDPTSKSGYKLVGDVDYAAVAPKAAWITPVPGGVGQLTVVALLINTLKSARNEVY